MEIKNHKRQVFRTIGRVCGWLTMAFLLFTLLTGYGISEFRIVSTLTFDLLNKAVAQRLHAYTEAPMVILLLLHVGIAVGARRYAEKKQKEGPYDER